MCFRVQWSRLRNKIRDQTEHAQYILETIAKLEQCGEVPARPNEIQEGYERVADAYGATPLTTLKSIQDHLSDLQRYGESASGLDPEYFTHARLSGPSRTEQGAQRRSVLRVRTGPRSGDRPRDERRDRRDRRLKAHEIHSLTSI
ncbi:cell division control protein Ccd6 [Halobiforma lacisalsi AJ5]|uniref:Cell division control protein 6-like protein n=1 Tax=Natronobacterium lacisalsi AJ5 TaxID=358396 RepID=M0L3M0_NATLA|nr:cell division control protein Ccd6 [Halobiforma lacisalsi AJ5]EMA28182.1 cell division control protein 6-like protein [Halobiforma lacisalsi AJ5]